MEERVIMRMRPRLLGWLHRSRSGPISLVRRLSYKDIKRGTDSFCRIIYSNDYGTAYKAKFTDGQVALVKEVNGLDEGEDNFYEQVELLGRLHHRHILALKGFSTGRKRLLVFENIEFGNLKEHLNDPLKTPLNWKTRLRIAVGVAAALEYLFLFSNPSVYRVNISSSTIVLDESFNAKLSDVGLLLPVGNVHAVSNPPCSKDCEGQSCGSIIFQLGVLLLELITGQSSEKTGLIQWIQEAHFRSSIQKMIDPDLGNNYDSRELRNLLAVARLCTTSGCRPRFSVPQLFRYLQNKLDNPHQTIN